MRSPFLMLGCALSVAILPTANVAQAKPVLKSAHIMPQFALSSANVQTDTSDEETPEERAARLKKASQRKGQERDKKSLPERDQNGDELPETTLDDNSETGDTTQPRTQRKSAKPKPGKNGTADNTADANDADSDDNMPLRNAPRTPRKQIQPLELFGYSYFTQARETIQMRRTRCANTPETAKQTFPA